MRPILWIVLLLAGVDSIAQKPGFYHLSIDISIGDTSIVGSNKVVLQEACSQVKLSLAAGFEVDSVFCDSSSISFERKGDELIVNFVPNALEFTVYYHGVPQEAKNPPWEGGFVWEVDSNDVPWVSVACQGDGGKLWWPVVNGHGQRPDSMLIQLSIDDPKLEIVSNGSQRESSRDSLYSRATWKVQYPINDYNVTFYAGDYVHLHEEMDELDLDYYVLRGNDSIAQAHFKQVKPMLEFYEESFGPYPFPKDGYALVEAPYWGMEHQGAIAYGNGYKNNEYGFDFIIVHETAHEYWGNSLTCRNSHELWIHESLATYTEAMYLEFLSGAAVAEEYLMKQRNRIANKRPMLYKEGNPVLSGTDIYFKGTWMLHTLRHSLGDDDKWSGFIKNLYLTFQGKHVTTLELLDFTSAQLGQHYSEAMAWYLNHAGIPILEVRQRRGQLKYRWAMLDDYPLAVNVLLDEKPMRLCPKTKSWTKLKTSAETIAPDTRHFLYDLKLD